jgi:alkylhydroperoxidase family enzyme
MANRGGVVSEPGERERRASFVVEPLDGQAVLDANAEHFTGMDHIVGSYFPNSLRIMARDPELLRVSMALGGVIMRRPGRIGIPLKWLIGHMTSSASGCRYCTAHTIEHAADVALTPAQVADIWAFETSEHFNDAQRSAMRFALAAGQSPNAVTAAEYEDLRHYYDDDAIVEIVSVVSYWAFWNRWNDTLATPLEQRPLEFARQQLTDRGWEPGRHA